MTELSNAREVTKELQKVRQARQYTDQTVDPDVVQELLQIARWTGSSRNTQPWEFIAISDKKQLQAIADLRTPIAWVAEAPLAIAIVLNGESEMAEAYDEGRVTERLLIGAHVLGLGGGIAWFGDDALQSKAKEFLGIPRERTARAVVAIGFPKSVKDPRPNPATPGRRPLDELVSYDRMGNRTPQ